jgi:hypothetical protein
LGVFGRDELHNRLVSKKEGEVLSNAHILLASERDIAYIMSSDVLPCNM